MAPTTTSTVTIDDQSDAITPPGPTGRENLRILRQLFDEPAPALRELADTFGPVCALGFGPVRIAVIGDATTLRAMMSTNAAAFRWRHRYNKLGLGFVVGRQSLIVSDGEAHRRRRHAVQGAFSPPRLREWTPMVRECTDDIIAEVARTLPTTGVLEWTPLVRRLILEITVNAFFGRSFAGSAEEIGALMRRPQGLLEASAIRQVPHPFPFTLRSGVRRDRRDLDRMIDVEIDRLRTTEVEDHDDLLGVLVRSGSLSDAEIRDQVVTLLGAGFDTTSAALTWMLLQVGTDPAVAAKIRSEADQRFDQAAERGDMSELPYAGRVVRESLRLHPPALLGIRMTATDQRIGQFAVRGGTLVVWSPYLAGRDERSWPDAARFNPDRFLDPTEEQRQLSERAWVPFGRGPHMCIGFALAQMELTMALSRLIQRLDIETLAREMPRPVGTVVNRPEGGAVTRVRLRR